MKRRITGNNRQKYSSLDAAMRVDRLVKLQREKHGGTINEALEVISRSHPQLYKTSLSGTGRGLDDEDLLAQFLNTRGNEAVREILEPVVNWETAPPEGVQKAAATLAEKLSEWKTSWYAHVVPNKKPFFMWSSPGDIELHLFYGMIATSLQTGLFWKLRQCKFCNSFFVSENQREYACSGKQCEQLRKDKVARESKRKVRRGDPQEEENLASRLITKCRIDRFILNDLQLEGKLEKTIKKIRDGFNKGWSSKKIVERLSGHEKKRLADEYENIKPLA
jgi:hypothetical protein